ncbi:MAG: hypothetical protein AB7N76_11495 [Planctomycetota bacterium]
MQKALEAQGRAEELEQAMSRLIPLVPYYCIEAWTYQNLAVASAICGAGCPRQAEHAKLFQVWATDRSRLDEVAKLPDTMGCLGKGHNQELVAQGYPAQAVIEAEASLGASAQRVLTGELRGLVLQARPQWRKDQDQYLPPQDPE